MILARAQSWFRSILGRQKLETEMEEEIRFHLEARTADLVRDGLAQKAAARRARLEFGTVAAHKYGMRSSLGLHWWDELWADLRYAARILRKSPGFTLIAVGSLALAIGANTTIFSVANEVLYERLGVPHPEQLRLLTLRGDQNVIVHSTWGSWDDDAAGASFPLFSYPVYANLKAQNQVLQPIFAFKDVSRANVTIDGNAQAVQLGMVSGNLYQEMQVRPMLGRAISPSDDSTPGAGAVALLSYSFWDRAFGRSTSVIGKVITVNMTPVTIIGVNPKSFTGAATVQSSPELFMPLSMIPLMRAPPSAGKTYLSDPDLWWVQLMARARPGVSVEQAQASLNLVMAAAIKNTMKVTKSDTMPRLFVQDGSKGLKSYGKVLANPIYVLLAMVGFLLLLACANTANLMLARASSRQREMAVRLALGAGRWRILRQVLIESLSISAMGGVLGLLLGYLGRTALPRLMANAWEAPEIDVQFNWKVFAFTAAVTILTGLLFGIAPAWAATKAEISTALKQGANTASRQRKAFTGKSIVAFQVAVSTLLVVAAALFARTILNLNSIDPGFRPEHLVLFDVAPPDQRYPAPKDIALHARLEDALRQVPGVDGVALTDVPLVADSMSNSDFIVEGLKSSSKDRSNTNSVLAHVGPDFFPVMGIPILAGRGFTQQDAEGSKRVAIVNQALAQKFFPGQYPVGRRFEIDDRERPDRLWIEIIGVCANTRYRNLQHPVQPVHFDLYRQEKEVGGATYVVRTKLNAEAIAPSLRAAVQGIDRDLPLIDIRTQQQQIDATTQTERMFAALTAGFGVLALALACVGIYGIMAYTVTQRTNEMGIRLALGAERGQVRALVLREAGWLACVGVVAGLAVALGLGRLVKTMLYGLQPSDPVSLIGGGGLLLAVALIAGWVPAMRASRVEPMEALRHE